MYSKQPTFFPPCWFGIQIMTAVDWHCILQALSQAKIVDGTQSSTLFQFWLFGLWFET